MEIKIDKNVPMPVMQGRESKYPFSEMEVGDSFFVAGMTSNQMNNASSHYRKKHGWSFICRNVEFYDEGPGINVKGARIWRVK